MKLAPDLKGAISIGVAFGLVGLAGSEAQVKAKVSTQPPCFENGPEEYVDLPNPDMSHYYTLQPGELVESPFALPQKPRLGDPLPIEEFIESQTCVVFKWSRNPGGAGGTEYRAWDENGFQWKRIKVNPNAQSANYDTKGPLKARR